MSKYAEYQTEALRDREVLLAALAELGYGPDKVEVHEQPVHLVGYEGRARPEVANIVIRQQHTGISASNDVGFLRQPDGSYRPIVSEYDSRNLVIGKQRLPLVKALEQAYGRLNADRNVRHLLKTTIPQLKARGLIPFNATIKPVKTEQQTRVVVVY